jgi:hypothetical protein
MKYEVLEIEGLLILVTYYSDSDKSSLLLEAKFKGMPLVGTYSVIKHQPHTTPGEYHLHVYDGQDQIFAINKSGKGHDGYHGVRIQNKVYQALMQKYKGWAFQPDHIIESVYYTYICRPISDLSYSEILNEIHFLQQEMNLSDRVQLLLEGESKTTAQNNYEIILKRFQALFSESVKRIS